MTLLKGEVPIFKLLRRWLMRGKGPVEARTWLDKITIDQRGEEIVLSCARIVLIEAKGGNISFMTADNAWLKPGIISHYERNLDPDMFLRIHRSTIVNKKKIARVSPLGEGRLNFHMSNDRVVSSSETYQEAIDKALPQIREAAGLEASRA